MNKKSTDIVSYIAIVGWLIAYLTGDKEHSKFHLNQSLVIHIANLIVSVASAVFTLIKVPGIVFTILNILLFICWVIGLVAACQGQEKKIPVIGDIKIIK